MLSDLRNGIWSELKGDPVDIDLYRRNLQRSFVEILDAEVGREVTSSDLPALTRAELQSLFDEIVATLAQKKVTPPAQVHLLDLKFRIGQALMPKSIAPSATPTFHRPDHPRRRRRRRPGRPPSVSRPPS